MNSPEFACLKPETIKIIEKIQGYRDPDEALAANPGISPAALREAMEDFEKNLPEITRLRDSQLTEARKPESKELKRSPRDSTGYQIKITLARSKPPIWRRVVVPAKINLEDLSDVILAVMGWAGGHLHGFEIGGEVYDGLFPDGSEPDEKIGLPAWKSTLCEEVPAAKMKFRYEYDFGDGWTHELLVEKIIPASEKSAMFTCTGGKGRCPPEDCGGLWGYYGMLKTLSEPNHPEYQSILEWCGGPIDPNEFSVEEANAALAQWRH